MMLKKLWTCLFLLGALSLSACGFHLRGTTTKTTNQTHTTNHEVALLMDDHRLITPLKKELALNGFGIGAHANRIQLFHLGIERYELIGVLSEVRLVMSADIAYTIDGSTTRHRLTATQSYQHNEAGLSTQDKESAQITQWLYDDLARQISEQYYALSQHQSSNH